VVWGADLLARKERLGQLVRLAAHAGAADAGRRAAVPARDDGDDLGTTFILLVIFLALLWVIGTPGRVFGGLLILMALAMMLMIVTEKYRFERLTGFFGTQGSATGQPCRASRASTRSARAASSAWAWAPAGEKWGWVPESTSDFIFAIIGEELGLVGTLCVTFLYGGLAFAGLRIARRVPDVFCRLAATAITAWIVVQAAGEHRRGDRRPAHHRGAVAAGLRRAVVLAGDLDRARHAHVVRQARTRCP
jgi:cell division protein FtsW